MSTAPEFVDATVFLGMHATDEAVRASCASYFAERVRGRIAMSLDEVGRCDDLVWLFPRAVQDAYYPFMDTLQTDVRFDRLGWSDAELARAGADTRAVGASSRLLLAKVAAGGGTLRTLDPALLALPDAPVRPPDPAREERVPFPAELEDLYRRSLVLRVDLARLGGSVPCGTG
jgi:Family of unknown function (DUF6190)